MKSCPAQGDAVSPMPETARMPVATPPLNASATDQGLPMNTLNLLPLSTVEAMHALRRARGEPGLMGHSIAALESRLRRTSRSRATSWATAKPAAMSTTSISSTTGCARRPACYTRSAVKRAMPSGPPICFHATPTAT